MKQVGRLIGIVLAGLAATVTLVPVVVGAGDVYWFWRPLVLLPMFVTPPVYVGRSGSGTVLDAATQRPLEGAIVLASWGLWSPAPGARSHLVVRESVTDELGRFAFPRWGPRVKRPLWAYLLRDPELIIFRSSYRVAVIPGTGGFFNPVRPGASGSILLTPFAGSEAEYADSLGNAQIHWDFALGREDCLWKEVPHFVLAVDEQARKFAREGITSDLLTLDDIDQGFKSHGCGSVREYMRSHRL